MSKLWIAPTSISTFLACPAQFKFKSELKPKGTLAKALRDGIAVHALMEGKTPEEDSPSIRHMANQLQKALYDGGYEVIAKELRGQVTVGDFTISRVIDAVAMIGDKKVLIDYKTASSPWAVVGDVAPQAVGYQAVAYLVPPAAAQNPYPDKQWPDEIHFMVTTPTDGLQTFIYEYSEEDMDNLKQVLAMVSQAYKNNSFPKNPGWSCGRCDFRYACFQSPGWEDEYLPKKGK